MALKPDDGETFLREVDEELRKERVSNFVTRYGWWIIAAMVLFLGAVGGWLWWQHRAAERTAAQGAQLLEVLDDLEANNRAAAQPKIAELTESNVAGYRAAGLFTRANSEIAAGNAPAAIATLRQIAQDQSLDETYRNAALIRQTALEFDALPPQQVVQRLRPLARPGSPWLGSAGELVGVAYIKMRRPDLAGQIFAQIGRDETVPVSIRTRAVQMASSLGVSAVDEEPAAPAAGAPAGPAPAEAREKAE